MTKSDWSTTAQAFFDACMDMNSFDELKVAATCGEADITECHEWGITEDEWFSVVSTALLQKIEDQMATIIL